MSNQEISLLADEIVQAFDGVAVGHCARVDYLTRRQVDELCSMLNQRVSDGSIVFHILSTKRDSHDDPRLITTDQAIEIRNRKRVRLCLFVPSDLVDAAFSSLANAFALIDGRQLQTRVLNTLREQLPIEAQNLVRAVFARLRSPLRASDDQKLDFVAAIGRCAAEHRLDQAGKELWRIGLIADSRETFDIALDSNRSCAIKLAHPSKLQASATERIASLGVIAATGAQLATFFRGRSMNIVRDWSRALADGEGPTFEQWVFPEQQQTDIRAVTVQSFVDREGAVQRYCKLAQPDGPGGSLIARYGPKESIVVKWTTDPPQPLNLSHWLVEVVPTTDDIDVDLDLPAREIAANKRTLTIKLDLDLDTPPDCGLCVRVIPLDASNTPLLDPEMDEGLRSDEFFLSPDIHERPGSATSTRRRTVPTIAFGRLDAAMVAREQEIVESEPLWHSRELEYFSVRVNERRTLNVALSATLLEVERRIIGEPRSGGRFVLNLSDLSVTTIESWVSLPIEQAQNDGWNTFWRARDSFFSRLKKAHPRDVIEVAEWTEELAGAALRYAQAYRSLLEELRATDNRAELRDALSIDTTLIRVAPHSQSCEEALLVMPTHPLRVAWYASYSQLLRTWESSILERNLKDRKECLDLASVRLLAPTNTPAFLLHPEASGPFAFFQNLRFFHGVALPSRVIDPQRRFAMIATIVGADLDVDTVDELQPMRLAEYLRSFRQLHAYTNTLITTLVNVDQGHFFTLAVETMLRGAIGNDDNAEPESIPSLDMTAFETGHPGATMPGVERLRQLLNEHGAAQAATHLTPLIATTFRPMDELHADDPPDAHLAVVADITHPAITAVTSHREASEAIGSFAFYGLITRFVPEFSANDTELRWSYRITDGAGMRAEAHPAGQRYGDVLTELHNAILAAVGQSLEGQADARPAIEVTIDETRRTLLERLHRNSNWVITLDRFFALDYYDSPRDQRLSSLARKYVIDYTPEFAEGLGHRMLVTTAFRDEIEALLARVMDELGFASVEESVGQVLHYLKTISGRLALRVTESINSAAEAVGLGVVTAYLQQQRRLEQAVLVPVDSSPRLFAPSTEGAIAQGERRCDFMLMTLKRNIVEATLIEVKLRRGNTVLESLAKTMLVQMESSAAIVRHRFFSPERVDGPLQRAYLANVIRFYVARAHRYGLITDEVEHTFLDHLARLEKAGLDFRTSYEGYIVSLDEEPRRPFTIGEAKIHVITARDIAMLTDFVTTIPHEESSEPVSTPSEDDITNTRQSSEPVTDTASDEQPSQSDHHPSMSTDSVRDDTAVDPGAMEDVRSPSSESETNKPPPAPPTDVVITLGDTAGGQVDWKPGVKGSPHLFIIGIPGQGKSWAVTRILSHLGQQAVPALVLDFHGQFAEEEGVFAQTVAPTIIDAAEGLPFSPFECQTSGRSAADWRNNSYIVSEIMATVGGLGGMQRDVLYSAIQDAYKARGFGGGKTEQPSEYPTPDEVLHFLEQRERSRKVNNVVARCRPILEMDLFKPDSHNRSLLAAVRSGLVIDLHNLVIETVQLAAGAFVLRQIYKDMFRWGVAEHLRLAIVLDEAHRLAKDTTLLKLMKEGRKYGIAVVVASQGMSDFHPEVLGNAGTKVIFRTNYPESRKIAGFIRARPGTDLATQIESLQVGQAYVQTSEMQYGMVTRMRGLDE
jgi:DNA phosphorothioation-dependent restriction protein DptH